MNDSRKPGPADIDEDPNVEIRPYSSPPCYAHEVDPAYFGLPAEEGTSATRLRRALEALDAIEKAAAVVSPLVARR